MGHKSRKIAKDGFLKALAKAITGVVVFLLVAAGCGYRFVPGGEGIDQNLQKVYVETFSNRTSEPGIENDFRGAFIDQFIKGGRFKLVDQHDLADAVLKGSIEGLSTSHLSYRSDNLAAEERMDVTMGITFEERLTKKIIWVNKSFSGREDYVVDTRDLSVTQTSRKTALAKLAKDSAEKAYRMMMSGF